MIEQSQEFIDVFWEEIGRLSTLKSGVDPATQQSHIANELCKAARRVIGADGACVVLREGQLVHYCREDAIAPMWAGQRFPIGNCISGWSILHGVPVVIEDIYTDSRIPIEYYRDTFVKSLVMQPIERTTPFGAIGVYWAKTHVPSARHLRFLQALGDLAALVLTAASLNQAVGNL